MGGRGGLAFTIIVVKVDKVEVSPKKVDVPVGTTANFTIAELGSSLYILQMARHGV